MTLTINGQQISVQGIRPLRPGITVEQAVQRTKNNGLDEIFFTSNGRAYVAYGDSLNLSGLKKNAIPAVMHQSQQADVIAYDDEVNSVWEGMRKGAVEEIKTGMNAVRTAVSNLITTVQPTVAVAGGIGIAGMGVYHLWRTAQGGAIGASMGLASGASAGAGQWIIDALKGSVVGGLKIAAISGGVGLAIMGGYGAIKGALEAKETQKDMASIASITEEGSSPLNGGQALNWPDAGTPVNTPEPTQPAPVAPVSPVTPQPGPGSGFGIGLPMVHGAAASSTVGYPISQTYPATGLLSPQQLLAGR